MRAANRNAHLAYLEGFTKNIVIAGPLLGEDGAAMIGSLLLMEFADRKAAEAFSAGDPYRKAGLFQTVTITPGARRCRSDGARPMAYWLLKSEPSSYSWTQMVKDGRTFWSGVRNFRPSSNMKAMKKGDRAFFYHSGDDKAVVGTVEIAKNIILTIPTRPASSAWSTSRPASRVKTPVTLAAIKAEPKLKHLLLVKQSRLSVGADRRAVLEAHLRDGRHQAVSGR